MRVELTYSEPMIKDNQQETEMKCPKCGNEMEQGMFTCGRDIASSALWTPQYELHKTFPKEEKIVERPVGVIHFYGYRCIKCRVLVLDY